MSSKSDIVWMGYKAILSEHNEFMINIPIDLTTDLNTEEPGTISSVCKNCKQSFYQARVNIQDLNTWIILQLKKKL